MLFQVFDEITKLLGEIELFQVTTLEKFKYDIAENEYYYGPYVYRKLLYKNSRFKWWEWDASPFDCSGHHTIKCDCEANTYYITKNIRDLNHTDNLSKFLIDSKKNIWTTITGFLSYNHENFDINIKNIVYCVFLIKKKYKLPKFITYTILKEYCKKLLYSLFPF
jgi:hypothetical protein